MFLGFVTGALTTYFVTFFPIYAHESSKHLHSKFSIWIINAV
jgi:hypothetical protein